MIEHNAIIQIYKFDPYLDFDSCRKLTLEPPQALRTRLLFKNKKKRFIYTVKCNTQSARDISK